MKKTISIIVTMVVILTLLVMPAGSVYAAGNHGADAHSPSMSVDTGENPIEDESTTLENGGEIDEEELEDIDEEEELEKSIESKEESEMTPIEKDIEKKKTGMMVSLVISIVALIGLVAFIAKETYKTKH